MAINTFPQEMGLTDAELDRLAEFLSNSKGGQAMNIEQLDGFFAALIAGPDVVLPSEYLPEVFGGKMSDTCEFAGLDEANDILGLIMQHWNGIAATLHTGNVHLPVLLDDNDGVCRGNDWSRGFMRGVEMRRESWAELILDEEQCGWMIPVLMLYYEHDEDPELRPGPIEPEKRQDIILQMAAGIVGAYRAATRRRGVLERAKGNAWRPHRDGQGRYCGPGRRRAVLHQASLTEQPLYYILH